MKFYKVEHPIIGGDMYVPRASADRMSLNDRRLFSSLKDRPLEEGKVFDYFRPYGFGDENNPEDVKIWEHDKYDFYDFIFHNPPAYLISNKLKMILDSFHVNPMDKFYPANFMFRNEKFDYYIFHQYHIVSDLIDFEHTKFCLYDVIENKPIGEYEGTKINKENLVSITSDLYVNKNIDVRYKKLVFKKYYDIYGPMAARIGYIMSEQLKDAMIEHNIKGLSFRKLDFEIKFLDDSNM